MSHSLQRIALSSRQNRNARRTWQISHDGGELPVGVDRRSVNRLCFSASLLARCTWWSQAEQRAASSEGQKTEASSLLQTSQRIFISLFSSSIFFNFKNRASDEDGFSREFGVTMSEEEEKGGDLGFISCFLEELKTWGWPLNRHI